jgi:UDP-N-acetylmuramate dehydrogenase
VSWLYENDTPYTIIGQGSNLLVSDAGIDLVVLRFLNADLQGISEEKDTLIIEGHMLLDDFVHFMILQGYGEVTFLSGIPGTVGGAVVGNAGAFGEQIGDIITHIEWMDEKGSAQWIPAEEANFTYRSSAFKKKAGAILRIRIKKKSFDIPTMQQRRNEILELRAHKHPNWALEPCAGSIFRNIEAGSAAGRRQAAGWFLEQAGAKKLAVGKAHLYEKHANIIIAEKRATASDVYTLMQQMKKVVHEKYQIELIPEIKCMGTFPDRIDNE